MKLLLDENLSPRLAASLEAEFPGSTHVHLCGLGSADDKVVWEYAKAHEFAIVSKDSDFAERAVLNHEAQKVIWIRLGNCSTTAIEKLLLASAAAIRNFAENGEETCLILTQTKTPSSATP